MANIFINYRRADSTPVANIIYKKLVEKNHHVFMDKKAIPKGFNFIEFIGKELPKYDVMLSLISNQWLTIKDNDGKVRIKNRADHVRVELSQALQSKKIKIIPVLVDGVKMPDAKNLPPDIRELSMLNAVEFISDEYDESADMIISEIEKSLNLLTSRDMSPYVKIMDLQDDRSVVIAIKMALEANLLANGIVAEIDMERFDNDVLHASRLPKGSGTYFKSAIYAAGQYGLMFKKWKRKINPGSKDEMENVHTGAIIHRMKSYPVTSTEEMIRHLNASRLIIAGVRIYVKSWYSKEVAEDGLLLSPPESNEQFVGAHAIVITQVDLVKGRIRFANSWGDKWGDKGFGYFSEQSFPKYSFDDNLWAIEVEHSGKG